MHFRICDSEHTSNITVDKCIQQMKTIEEINVKKNHALLELMASVGCWTLERKSAISILPDFPVNGSRAGGGGSDLR